MQFNRKQHWENIYQTKQLNEVSWYQPTPETSLSFVHEYNLALDAKIIDVGGGDSFLVDHLLNLGYKDITVLDISKSALERCKRRLGEDAKKVKWIEADAANFTPTEQYDFWHDRAAFHFLTDEKEIIRYMETVQGAISQNGIVVIGTFSDKGPLKCSGIEITQYTEQTLTERMHPFFERLKCFTIDHQTPFETIQNFVFCSFRKI